MRFGEVKTFNNSNYKKQIHYGKFYTLKAIYFYLKGCEIIRWWVGTDSDTLIKEPPGSWYWRKIRLPLHRIKARLTNYIINYHYYGSDNVKDNLIKFGFEKSKLIEKEYDLLYPTKVNKSWPVILLHIPKYKRNAKYKRWYHGIDISNQLMEEYKKAYYFIVDNSQDMRAFFSKSDICILTKRATGKPRLKRECELNNISVYYYPHNPNIEDIIKFIKENINETFISNRTHIQN